ncbi:MAG TPA: DUF481 domain-containing protein [Puia sp.]|nr:DUF481 domain-containing protein [Puia sp.]
MTAGISSLLKQARKLLGIILVLGVCIPAKAQQKDSIYLYNGQILIGEIQGASLGSITIDDIDLKLQDIKLYKIRRIKTIRQFKIETVDKKTFYGSFQTNERNGWIDLLTDLGVVTSFPITDLYTVMAMDKNFFKRIDGSVSAGLSYAKSSGIGQVNLSANARYSTRLLQFQLTASELGSIDSSRFSRDNENVDFFVARDLGTTWFLAAETQYQRNLELSIARRYLEMLGGGNRLVIKTDWQLLAISGITFTQEKSTDGSSGGVQFEIPLMFRFNYYKGHHPDLKISSSQTAYFNLSEKGRFRYEGSTNVSWQIIRYFYLTLSPYTSVDTKPPATGSTFDFGIVFGLSYQF